MKDLLRFRRTLTRREYWITLILLVAVSSGLLGGSFYVYANLLPPESSWTPAHETIFIFVAIVGLVCYPLSLYLFLVVIVARCKDAGIPIRFVIAGLILLFGLQFTGESGFLTSSFLALAALLGLGFMPAKISEEERFRRKVIAEAGENVREQFKDEMEEIAGKYTPEEVEEIIRQLKAEERNARPEEKP